MMTSTGGYVMPAVDKISVCGYREGHKHDKKEDPPFPLGTQPEPEVTSTVPDELVCVLCKLLMVNAAIVPCCGYSFCDNCEFLLSLSVNDIYIYIYIFLSN